MRNIILILSSVLLNSAAQLFLRKGMLLIGESGIGSLFTHMGALITNLWLWGAMICYAFSIFLWMSVLSKVEVSFAYPFLSVGYIVVAISGYLLFNESLSLTRILGILVICIGVYLISRS